MSQWTHVNASFRLDSFGRIEDEELINDRKMLSDVWRDVVIYGVQRGCNDKCV